LTALDKFKIIKPHLEEGITIQQISSTKNIPIRTLNNWIKSYRTEGFSGLERKRRSDFKTRKVMDEISQKMVTALALQKPKLSITTIHYKISQEAKQRGIVPPSYSVVYDMVSKLDPALLTLAHEGSVAYRDKYEIIFRREAESANQMWQIDHTPLDIFLLNEKGVSQKPWLTIVQDDYSRAVSGYFLSFEHPSAVNTALALRQAIWRKGNPNWQVCGIPEILYSDNGSDFTSEHIQKVCATLKIRMVNSIPGRPQGKGKIERIFLTMLNALLERLPGYAPSGYSKVKAELTLPQFQNYLEEFILEEYHHSKHGTTNNKPMDRWLGDGFLPQMPDSLEQLDYLLMTVPKPRTVRREGIFFKTLRYMNLIFVDYVGEDVTIRYDPRDLAEVRVYFEGEFICTAICQDIANQVISLKEIKKTRQKRRKELRGIIQDSKSFLRQPNKGIIEDEAPKQSTKKTSSATKLKLYKND